MAIASLGVLAANEAAAYTYSLASGKDAGGSDSAMLSQLGTAFCELHVYGSAAGPNIWGYVEFRSPSGVVLGYKTGETYTTHLVVRLEHAIADGSPGGQYMCAAVAQVDSDVIGEPQAPLQVKVPGSVSVFSDLYHYQSFNQYLRERGYQVQASGGGVWDWDGASVTESFNAFSPNGCGFPPITQGNTLTETGGQFYDMLGISGHPQCNSTPNCQSKAVQKIWVGGYLVKQHTVTYRCDRVDMP